MAVSRAKAPTFTSFKGTFKYPSIHKPDFGSKDYPDADGSYRVKLVGKLTSPDVQAMLTKLKPLHAAAKAEAERKFKELKPETRKKLGAVKMADLYTELLDKETEEPTGEIEVNFKMKASGTYQKGPKAGETWSRKPAVFDARGNKLSNVPEIWGGTTGKISFEVGVDFQTGEPGYFIPGTGSAGLKLSMLGVQIIDLVQGGERSAAGHGFGDEGAGFEADQGGFSDESTAATPASTVSADDDF